MILEILLILLNLMKKKFKCAKSTYYIFVSHLSFNHIMPGDLWINSKLTKFDHMIVHSCPGNE